jgi:histidine phosphotransferase ChpT
MRSAMASALVEGNVDEVRGPIAMVELSDIDLAALLCSRVCHDVISPVGAVANGLEVLEDEDDEAMREIALDLVRKSARQASAKLQFCRLAYGASGSQGVSIDLGEAGDVAAMFVGEEKVKLDWRAPRESRPKLEVKLVLNMMLVAMGTIPRGGVVEVSADAASITARSRGENARIADKLAQVLDGSLAADEMDARLVQPYYMKRLADEAGFGLVVELTDDGAAITAMRS